MKNPDLTHRTLCRLLSSPACPEPCRRACPESHRMLCWAKVSDRALTSTLGPDDWRLLAAAAQREGVAPLLYHALKEQKNRGAGVQGRTGKWSLHLWGSYRCLNDAESHLKHSAWFGSGQTSDVSTAIPQNGGRLKLPKLATDPPREGLGGFKMGKMEDGGEKGEEGEGMMERENMSVIRRIFIPPDVTADHRTVVRRYVERIGELSSSEWPLVIEAFNLLRHAVVVRVDDRAYTFAQVYEELVDARYATPFIEGLLDLEDVGRGSIPLWAAAARHIYRGLTEMGLHDPERYPESRLLMAYCLYWWQSFCKGYAFEVEICCDLERSGLRFQAHDLLDPAARRSPHDLFISDFRGDVKTSVYFLLKASGERVSSDFFITRVWLPTRRARTLAVFLQDVTWETIDGETLLTLLSDLGEVLPRPARIFYHGGELVVADYADWKEKMRDYQRKREE